MALTRASLGDSYVGPRLLVTSNRSAAGSGSRQALSRRGDSVCATSGDRDPGPRSGRSLARGSPHQPSGSPDGTRSRGLVDQGAELAAASASSAPRAGGRDWEVPAGEPAYLRSCMPGPGHARSRPRGFVPSAPLVPVALPRVGASGGSTSQQCPLAVDALGRDTTSSCLRMIAGATTSQRAHWQGTQRARAIGIGARPRCRPQVAALRTALQVGSSPEAAPQFGSNLRQRRSQGQYAGEPRPAIALVPDRTRQLSAASLP
jgi:hypothetical protein